MLGTEVGGSRRCSCPRPAVPPHFPVAFTSQYVCCVFTTTQAQLCEKAVPLRHQVRRESPSSLVPAGAGPLPCRSLGLTH